jgi:hypothetical protein
MDYRYYRKLQFLALKDGKFSYEAAEILVSNLHELVKADVITYGYLGTTAEEMERILLNLKSKPGTLNRV